MSRLADRFYVAIGWFMDHQRYSDKARAALHEKRRLWQMLHCNSFVSLQVQFARR
jgi:hypothetical protein